MTTMVADQPLVPSNSDLLHHDQDPFTSPSSNSIHYRFSHFDNQLFAFSPTTSPDQAKRALTAHLAETERRIQEASKLGTTLLQQRKNLAERLDEVEKQQAEDEISPELRQKLAEIEKEYNDVGRDSARAFLPKPRVSSKEISGSPYGDCKRSGSPLKEQFETMGIGSPSKLGVINRRQRNQPINRVHDIEFATEISTSLLSQVRHLQTLLAEKEEQFKTVNLEKTRLEVEAEGFTERLRSLNESGERYKDENWSLETQVHEFIAKDKEAADRERRLVHNLNILQVEKSAAQKELDEIKSTHAKLSEEHMASCKHYDVELGNLRRNLTLTETEKGTLQRKIEELRSQNQELVKAVAYQRGRFDDRDQSRGLGDEELEVPSDDMTPEHSPPPSPIKGTPRHGMLETETLKSSLQHAHRMIQNLKGNIHREKTEKFELKRLLQDARDELELRRGDLGSANGKKSRKAEVKEYKKPLKLGYLGGMRNSMSEIYNDDPNWEDYESQIKPSNATTKTAHVAPTREMRVTAGFASSQVFVAAHESSDNFETANEQETTDAFESANERAAETDDVQTGDEDTSEVLTEKECGNTRTMRWKASLSLPGNRQSFQSTASTSDDDYQHDEIKSTSTTPSSRLRLRFGRRSNRRSRVASEEPPSQSSPSSLTNTSRDATPHATGQSLFAELGDMGGSDEEGSMLETPIQSRHASVSASPTPTTNTSTVRNTITPLPLIPSLPMVDAGVITEPCEHTSQQTQTDFPYFEPNKSMSMAATETLPLTRQNQSSVATQISPSGHTADAASQWYENSILNLNEVELETISASADERMDTDHDQEVEILDGKLNRLPQLIQPPVDPLTSSLNNALNSDQPHLSISQVLCESLEPVKPVSPDVIVSWDAPQEPLSFASNTLAFSPIQFLQTKPLEMEILIPKQGTDSVCNHKNTQGADRAQNLVFPVSKFSTKLPCLEEDLRSLNSTMAKDETFHVNHDQTPHALELSTSLSQYRAARLIATDGSSQTALTAHQIDEMLKGKRKESTALNNKYQSSSACVSPSNCSTSQSQNNIEKTEKFKAPVVVPDILHDVTPSIRSVSRSSRSNRSRNRSQLLTDHKQTISAPAQKSSSSSEGIGGVVPPLPPISAYSSNQSFRRSKTHNAHISQSSSSLKDGDTCPRKTLSSATVESRVPSRNIISRVSSISSFASELETRFQLNREVGVSSETQLGTDPRMINAITQTMIGEYLWKYTRKTGRGAMSERRHRRYFWVHPYTRTLYWSERDPSSAGRAELKAKSVPIDAVRVVTDDNPMPPGLHRKSLIIMSPSRDVKFTAVTGQRHETWFNSLSYLLLRTEDDNFEDVSEEAKGPITNDDVSEPNGVYSSNRRAGITSMSSINSRTTRNEAYEKPGHSIGPRSSRMSASAFSRLSSYWKPGREGLIESLSSRHSKHSGDNTESIIAASQAHDSAEDLRQIIESQDRESDKLENVRACCDGRHDVGNLHSSIMSRHSKHVEVASGYNKGESAAVRFDTQAR